MLQPFPYPQPTHYVVFRDCQNYWYDPPLINETWSATMPLVTVPRRFRSDLEVVYSSKAVWLALASRIEAETCCRAVKDYFDPNYA